MTKSKATGWLPRQHGAWGMLIIPYLVGLKLSNQNSNLNIASALVGPTFFIGYFVFNASSLWLKSSPKHRNRFNNSIITYSAITIVLGLLTLILGSWKILTWALIFIPLLGITLYLVATHRERSILSGFLTVVAISLQPLVMCFWSPLQLWEQAFEYLTQLIIVGCLFGYFFGTIFYVKSMIRKKGVAEYIWASIIYHSIIFITTLALAAFNLIWWPWTIFFAATVLRTAILSTRQHKHPIKIRQVAVIEMVFAVFLLLLSLLAK